MAKGCGCGMAGTAKPRAKKGACRWVVSNAPPGYGSTPFKTRTAALKSAKARSKSGRFSVNVERNCGAQRERTRRHAGDVYLCERGACSRGG